MAGRGIRDDEKIRRIAGNQYPIRMIQVAFLRQLVGEARRLDLSAPDTLKFCASYYLSRLKRRMRGFNPPAFAVSLPFAGRKWMVPLRCNECDYRVLGELFVEHPYRTGIVGLKHILDLGANAGYSALYLAGLHPDAEIACVEPVPSNLVTLRETIRKNRLNVKVIDAAVSETDGSSPLFIMDSADSAGLSERQAVEVLEVQTKTVDSILRELGWSRIDLLKIDIEGAEQALFKDSPAWLDRVSHIVGELHHPYTFDECRRDLEPRGFVVENRGGDETYHRVTFAATRPTAST